MVRLLVLADDLTGALDTGVQFARRGAATLVRVERAVDFASLDPEPAVLAVDTESRHVPPAQAAEMVADAARRARKAGVEYYYKKTDSTLRGNVGAELEALMRAVGVDRLAFIPAYPKAGRTTRNGCQYVDGVPLAQSAFGRHPLEPAEESFVPAVLARQTPLPVRVISPRAEEVAAALAGFTRGIAVFDCESDGDLACIARILAAAEALGVTAGPAGFAGVLADLVELPRRRTAPETRGGPLLVVCGSMNEVSLTQVSFAARLGFADLALPADAMEGGSSSISGEAGALADRAVRAARQGRGVIVRAAGRADGEGRRSAAEKLARLAGLVLRGAPFGGCAVFGGDTALAVVKTIGCTGLLPADEITPGVVLSRLEGSPGGIDFITKAGGFGDEDVVGRIVDYLRKHSLPA